MSRSGCSGVSDTSVVASGSDRGHAAARATGASAAEGKSKGSGPKTNEQQVIDSEEEMEFVRVGNMWFEAPAAWVAAAEEGSDAEEDEEEWEAEEEKTAARRGTTAAGSRKAGASIQSAARRATGTATRPSAGTTTPEERERRKRTAEEITQKFGMSALDILEGIGAKVQVFGHHSKVTQVVVRWKQCSAKAQGFNENEVRELACKFWLQDYGGLLEI